MQDLATSRGGIAQCNFVSSSFVHFGDFIVFAVLLMYGTVNLQIYFKRRADVSGSE